MKTFLIVLLLLAGIGGVQAQSAEPDNGLLLSYFQQQQFDQAARYLESLEAAHPGDRHLVSMLGYAYYKAGDLTRASGCFQHLYDTDSSDLTACQYLGTIHFLKGDKIGALGYFCRLTELKPDVPAYHKQLAKLWITLGNAAAACYHYGLAYRSGGQRDPEVVSGFASGLVSQALYKRADSILDGALAEDSSQGEVLRTRIWSAFLQKNYPEIFPLAGKLAEMQDITQSPFLYAAIAHYYSHQFQACVETCDLLIVHNLSSRPVLYLLALSYKEQKKYTLSLLTLDECIASALSEDADGYFSAKGDIYEILKKGHQALREYDTAYYLFQNPLQLYNKARIYDADLKSPRTALKYYRLYRKGRRDTVVAGEKAALKYTAERIRQLTAWEKASKQASAQTK